ncbi:hypothetical protein KFK09_023621 [Dendrobium nobile]|uniref:Uncharacterized protein n=1 Tax=Dendrobium nobile TaxID=94219 RepID=A0A8T3ABP0_DENNO|nr:hypothetical protein KFK09_023621 [Dendrobium nobile]
MAIVYRTGLLLALILITLPGLHAICFTECFSSCHRNFLHCAALCTGECLNTPSDSSNAVKNQEATAIPGQGSSKLHSRKLNQLQADKNY